MKNEYENIYQKQLINKKQLEKLQLKKIKFDYKVKRFLVLLGVISILLVSIANMISTSFYDTILKNRNVILSFNSTSSKHITWIGIGVILVLFISRIPYKLYQNKNVRKFLVFASIGIMILMLVDGYFFNMLVSNTKGSLGWIKVGPIGIQPSEFIKIVYIIILAHLLEVATIKKMSNSGIVAMVLPIIFIYNLLIILQKDLGTAIHYIIIVGCMLFISPLSSFFIKSILLFIPIVYSCVIGVFYFFDVDGGYKFRRITSYVNILFKGQKGGKGIGYQLDQSLIAIGSGGFWGKGYGSGIQKYKYLPEIHTDFISSSLAEEGGFLIIIAILMVFLYIQKLAIDTAIEAKSYFAKYLVIGLGSLIFTQMLINLYVATGLMPIIGIPLPFLSYGGSSTLTIFISLGLILKINKDIINEKEYFL